MIVTYFGGLRHIECDALRIENFSVTTDGIVVTHSRAKVRGNGTYHIIILLCLQQRSDEKETRFLIPSNYVQYVQDYLQVVKLDLGKVSGRVWFTGRHAALVACSMGKNTISKVILFLSYKCICLLHFLHQIPFKVATFLELEDPEGYTFHSLRRTSASCAADQGQLLHNQV